MKLFKNLMHIDEIQLCLDQLSFKHFELRTARSYRTNLLQDGKIMGRSESLMNIIFIEGYPYSLKV